MKLEFDKQKNEKLRLERGICFDDVITALLAEGFIGVLKHPNPKKYPHQKVLLVRISDYVYVVPYVNNKRSIFLKTVFPSRDFTKKFINRKKYEK